jgi:hypothetical protein
MKNGLPLHAEARFQNSTIVLFLHAHLAHALQREQSGFFKRCAAAATFDHADAGKKSAFIKYSCGFEVLDMLDVTVNQHFVPAFFLWVGNVEYGAWNDALLFNFPV